MTKQLLRNRLYQALYTKWRRPAAPPRPGYSLMLFVPGDLPFFLDIFLRVFAEKDLGQMVEALVVPDRCSGAFRGRFARFADAWPHGAPRLVEFGPFDRLLLRAVRNPHANHWLQIVNATAEARSTHALIHDADLFLLDPDFFEQHYRECVDRGLACLGLAPAWDPWYAEVGLPHVTATWEMMYEVDWMRRFPPWMHRGHDGPLRGEIHTFDTTLLPQALTSPERVGRRAEAPDFVHFNYVICTYRFFQKSRASFEDEYFRILLIRLLIDAFDPGGWGYDAPAIEELARGLTDPSRRVTYRSAGTASHYEEFRGKLRRLLDAPLLTPEQRGRIAEGVRPFDRAYGGAEGGAAVAPAARHE